MDTNSERVRVASAIINPISLAIALGVRYTVFFLPISIPDMKPLAPTVM